jgi:hypothetical protein
VNGQPKIIWRRVGFLSSKPHPLPDDDARKK